MKKTLVLIIVALALASSFCYADSVTFIDSYFKIQDFSIRDLFTQLIDFFKGGISGLTGFAGYSYSGSSNLTIWDEGDDVSFPFAGKYAYLNENIYFFANLTNSTGSPINSSSANVSICINFTPVNCGNMSYNSSADIWSYSALATSSGIIGWNVTSSFVNSSSLIETLNANDSVFVNRCLNLSNLSGDYYITGNRVVCSGNHNFDYTVFFEGVSDIILDCNNSNIIGAGSASAIALNEVNNVSIKNCRFENFLSAITGNGTGINITSLQVKGNLQDGILLNGSSNVQISGCTFTDSQARAIMLENLSQSSVKNCVMSNSLENDLRALGCSYLNLTNITSISNSDPEVAIIAITSNFTKARSIRVFNSSGVFGFGFGNIFQSDAEYNNSLEDAYLENIASPLFGNLSSEIIENNSLASQFLESVTGAGIGAINQINLFVRNVTVKNVTVCGGEANSANSTYSLINFSNCGVAGFSALSVSQQPIFTNPRITFENSSISNSRYGFVFIYYSPSQISSIKNILISGSNYTLGLENSSMGGVVRGITAINTQRGVFSSQSTAELSNSSLSLSGFPVEIRSNSQINFSNVTFNQAVSSYVLDSSVFIAKWPFNVMVRDFFQNPLENVNVTVSGNSIAVLSDFSNASGSFSQWKSLAGFEQTAASGAYVVYSATAVLPQFVPESTLFQINSSMILNINLTVGQFILISSPVNNKYYNSKLINLSYSSLFNNTAQCWYINVTGSTVNLPGCLNTTFTANEGYNNITVFANSTEGNLTYSPVFFYVDTIFPNLTRFNISLVTNISVLMNWTTSEETNMSFKYWASNSASSSGYNSSFSNRSSYLIAGLTELKSYDINVTFCDRAGNCLLKTGGFSSGRGNYSPPDLHIPEEDIIVQELVAFELTATPHRSTLTPGSRYIYTIDSERHEVKLKYVYMEERAVFEFSSDPIIKEIPKGGTGEVDLDNDGINDVALTVTDIEMTRVSFDLKRISFKKEEVVPANGAPKEEIPALIETPVVINETEKPKTFFEKYVWYMLISLSVIVAIVVAGGAILLKRKMPVVIEIAQKKKLIPPKTSHLESLMKNVYAMLKDNKTELDVQKYLEDLNFEDNVIKSIVFEMKTNNNKIDQMISFSKKQFDKEKSVEEVRDILENAGWAKNIVKLVTEE